MLSAVRFFKKTVFWLVIILFFFFVVSRGREYALADLRFGITFSAKQASALGLDWRETYAAILSDLDAKKIRLSAYWDETEPQNGSFFWDDIDWQIDQASSRDAEIILAIGARLPRWPECHYPEWTVSISPDARNIELKEYLTATITRYKDNKNIVAWQIENEPFLSNFGECPSSDTDLLNEEIALAKSLDSRPIVVTDSGELSIWARAAKRADIFGTTMYRDTFSKLLNRYIHYPITPAFFKFKKNIVSLFARPQKWVVIELQGEPWGPIPFQDMTRQDRDRTMSEQKFGEMIDFIGHTGFDEFYWWGAEWWYWEKTKNNNPFFWDKAKSLFNK